MVSPPTYDNLITILRAFPVSGVADGGNRDVRLEDAHDQITKRYSPPYEATLATSVTWTGQGTAGPSEGTIRRTLRSSSAISAAARESIGDGLLAAQAARSTHDTFKAEARRARRSRHPTVTLAGARIPRRVLHDADMLARFGTRRAIRAVAPVQVQGRLNEERRRRCSPAFATGICFLAFNSLMDHAREQRDSLRWLFRQVAGAWSHVTEADM